MEFTELGRTGLKVSVAGLGCGGGSRLGRAAIKSGPRDGFVISTKSRIRRAGDLMPTSDIVANLDASLRRLDTD